MLEPPFQNDYDNPLLLIKYADANLPVIKKPKTSHLSEERKIRWEKLNTVLIETAAKNEESSDEESENTESFSAKSNESSNSSVPWKLISPIYKIKQYTQTIKEVP